MDKWNLVLCKYKFMYNMGGKVKNSEFYRLEPYLDGPIGLLVIQDLQEYNEDRKKLWRAVMFWPISGAQILFDEQIAAPPGDGVDHVAATALGFFTLSEADTSLDMGYTTEQHKFNHEHGEAVGALAYTDDDDSGDSLAHLRIP